MAKKSERSASAATKKNNKKKRKSQPSAVAMKTKASAPNPFESIWSRRKFDILGKKRKGEERRIGLARSRAIDKRKNTLLKEYERSGKASVFVDKRIGEDNEDIGEFQKALLRSQREYKLKLGKKSKYNLSDGEGDDFEHGGGDGFGGRDDFEDVMLPDDDDGAEPIDGNSRVLKQLAAHNRHHEGGTENEENRHRSKKEVMEEVIFKSKLFKAQKAKEKEENEQLMEELDKNFTALVESEALLSLTEPGKINALKALVNKDIPGEKSVKSESSAKQKEETVLKDQPDSYDKMVKAMTLDMRARPSDRTKTAEETAQEERERLERLEEERQKRMLAADDESDEDSEDVEKLSTPHVRSISGDDLGDSFSHDEETRTKKGWVDEILSRKDDENSEGEDGDSDEESESEEGGSGEAGSDEENDESEQIRSLKDWEQSEDDELDTSLDEETEDDEEQYDDDDGKNSQKEPTKSKKAKTRDHETKKKINDPKRVDAKSLPYLIEAPKSLEELNDLLDGHSNSEIALIISRVRVSNAIALAAENRRKMQVFYGVLLQYCAVLANKKPMNFELVNLLVKPLMEMSVEIPYFAAICARQRILRTRAQFCEAIKNTEVSSWPSLKTLFLLRLWSMVFPCSDFRHVVMTPVMLLMCEFLMRCPISSGRDIAVGSFLCSLVLVVTRQSRKFCPEAILFVQTLLLSALDRKAESKHGSQFDHLMEVRAPTPLLLIRGRVTEFQPLNFLKLMDSEESSETFDSDGFRASILANTVESVRGFVEVYKELSSFTEIFMPISDLLLEVAENKNMPGELQTKFKDTAQLVKEKSTEHQLLRQPLQMRKQKPVPIKLVNPKFEENFVKGRDYDPDKERAEARKLKKLIKQEAKGAIREVRKDNYFLSEVKRKEKAMQQEERADKYGKAKAFLQEQEHAFKSGQLGKGKGRKRRR